ncbi:Tripeptidyl-peptidase sed1 [Escovopsis weberi]|uniref:tripeptidyl-peptidase II n=1 Tax=Escovopsis weberi TaxID=150374 RepID=A0A0M8MUV9_ESCWE|nr:Tripeptidyl-peptidase sed1 [Escovopsis weberi]
MKVSLVLLNGLLAGSLAAPTSSDLYHEKRDASHPRWIKRGSLDPNTKVPVRIALKQQNLEKGLDYLLEVSDPTSKKYGQHYTPDQVVGLFAPSEDSVSTVTEWLVKSGIPASKITSSKSKGWLSFETTSGKLESLLNAQYHVFEHVEADGAHVGADSYSLPNDVAQHVEFVTPGVVFAPIKASSKLRKRGLIPTTYQPNRPVSAELLKHVQENAQATDSCGSTITPQCITAMYNITAGTLAAEGNRLGIFEASGEAKGSSDIFAQADLNLYFSALGTNVPFGTAPKVSLIDGATAPTGTSNAGQESDLDLEVSIPIIYPQQAEVFQTFVRNEDIFNTFLDAVDGAYCSSTAYGETGDDPIIDGTTPDEMCGEFTPSNVISFSYGTAEADYPTYYLQRQCDEFMKLGLQGSSIVFASGDDGVARRSGKCLGPNEDIFTPVEQGSCPYVTSVGATTLPAGSSAGDAETATTSFSSGGGFSNIWTTPSYQASAVANYFSAHDPGYASYNTSAGNIPFTGGIYNKAGRGYPDIAAVGDNAIIAYHGGFVFSGGTSMSAPIVAAILTRINEERIKAGKSVIGFANPALYQNPSMFHDITVGNQAKGGPNGDGNPSACGNVGFSAVSGWDPVTGLGTPNYPAMLEYFMSL